MRMLNKNLLVEFDETHNRVINGLYRPTEWVFEDTDSREGATTKYDVNRNKKETNPQIATVIVTNPDSTLKAGDKIFTHYLDYDTCSKLDYEGKEYSVIRYTNVFFKIKGEGDYEMMPDTYLGEQVFSEGLKTESGIYLTPYDKIKETLRVKLTHVPEDSDFKVGETVVTTDDFQYEIEIDGRKLIKLTKQWIFGHVDVKTA